MKFLLDAHLPAGLCQLLRDRGHDAIHTASLPAGNRTTDQVICARSLAEQRVVISKDADFYYAHLLRQGPWKLVLVRTGNMGIDELIRLFAQHLPAIEESLATHDLLELDRVRVAIREK